MKQLTPREQKIEKLRALMAGKINPKELKEPGVYFFYDLGGSGIYEGPDKKEYTADEVKAIKQTIHPDSTILKWVLQKGNEPMEEECYG
jgi:hypothetical protein